ncbi:sialin isoform X2 [Galleria mellonella]|uniref:Sialin isoform X2 n=1 Tax=Galleria mellonella TaxID=7137 RepID=A0ABM3MIE2_GALME|nr:sialin isoform X2 [Galleria mellonella]
MASGCLTCVQVLNIMVLLGFMLNYALRVNLTIAIVEMLYDVNDNQTAILNVTDSLNVTEHPEHIEQTRYHWDTKQKNLLLGCFFWGYVLTELPGGRLAEIVGARRVFGYSTLLASVLTLLTPSAAAIGFGWAVAVRVLLGFLLGATWPAILPMASKWIPPNDRSKFMSNMMASSLGAAITMPICGFLIAHFGWESAFYFTGLIGAMWSVAWFAVVYDTPADHPRISEEEKNYLMEVLPQDNTKKKGHMPVPWRSLLTSPPVWAIILTHATSVFGYFTVVNQLPTYIESILHYNIKHNGLLSSLPYLGKYLCALASSVLADSLRKSEKLSTTATRKLFTGFAVGVPGIMMLAQAYFGEDRVWSIAIFTLALTINGMVTAGYLGNGLDIAPNFSGTIFGLANTLSSFGGWLSTYMVGELTKENNTVDQWRIVFFILAGTYVFGAVTFVTLGSGELQPWNSPKEVAREEHEVEPLNEEKA